MRARAPWLWWLGTWLVACTPSEVIVGGGPASEGDGVMQPGASTNGAVETPLAQPSAFIAGLDADSPWLGRWTGRLDEMSDGTRLALELNYSEEVDGAVGRVTFGEGPPPSAARDPMLGYPQRDESQDQGALHHHSSPAEGFAYTVLAGGAEDGVLSFAISLNQLWELWCALQPTSYFHADVRSYSCVAEPQELAANGACQMQRGDELVEVDCDRMELCNSFQVCVCWPNDCSADLSIVEQFELTLSDDRDRITGRTSVREAGFALTRQ